MLKYRTFLLVTRDPVSTCIWEMRITLHSKEIGSWFWQVQRKSGKVVIFCILFVLYKDG